MSEKINQEQFRKLTQAWTMNNGILGFIDYFFYPHNRSAFYDTPEEMLTAYHDRDTDDSQPEYQWSIDDYVNEWWGYWQMGLAFVYNRSDGSILDWLYHTIESDAV